jgi:hypothetical protein
MLQGRGGQMGMEIIHLPQIDSRQKLNRWGWPYCTFCRRCPCQCKGNFQGRGWVRWYDSRAVLHEGLMSVEPSSSPSRGRSSGLLIYNTISCCKNRWTYIARKSYSEGQAFWWRGIEKALQEGVYVLVDCKPEEFDEEALKTHFRKHAAAVYGKVSGTDGSTQK